MRAFKLTIHGREVFDVDAYEPCDGATFVVHRARHGGEWLVTHRASTHIAHQPDINRRSEALAIAQKLHDGCPSAAAVHMADVGTRKGVSGPYEQLRAEIVAVLKGIGETVPVAA